MKAQIIKRDGSVVAFDETKIIAAIERAGIETSGSNFEILVGFDVTPEMAEFNRSGSRFRVNAGAAQPAAPSE